MLLTLVAFSVNTFKNALLFIYLLLLSVENSDIITEKSTLATVILSWIFFSMTIWIRRLQVQT